MSLVSTQKTMALGPIQQTVAPCWVSPAQRSPACVASFAHSPNPKEGKQSRLKAHSARVRFDLAPISEALPLSVASPSKRHPRCTLALPPVPTSTPAQALRLALSSPAASWSPGRGQRRGWRRWKQTAHSKLLLRASGSSSGNSSGGGGGQGGGDPPPPFQGKFGSWSSARAGVPEDEDFGGMDWRTFRAKLVAQSQALKSVSGSSPGQEAGVGLEIWQDRMSLENWAVLAAQNPQLAREVPWVHGTAGVEVGGVLIASPGMNQWSDERYRQVVVLLIQHDSRGSAGLILNRPSGYTLKKAMQQVNGVDAALSVFAGNAIYVGGYRSDGRTLHLLHGHPLPGAVELSPGVYLGGLELAAEKVLEGTLPALDFRFFVGRVEWMPGKLEEEIRKGSWFPAASARSLILKQCLQLPKPLWKEMLELMGGDYAETARREYGEIP